MQHPIHPNRRHLLAGLAAIGLSAPSIVRAQEPGQASIADGNGPLYAVDFGVGVETLGDQSPAMQAALDASKLTGRPLVLPAGAIFVRDLSFPPASVIEGTPGATLLTAWDDSQIGRIFEANGLIIRGVGFSGNGPGSTENSNDALLKIEAALAVTLDRCNFINSPSSGLFINRASVTINDCDFSGHADAAIHCINGDGLLITGNRITKCGNAGIRIWGISGDSDGSIITGNRISKIDWRGGGNGQNGNGINIFRADEVIVSDNHIADCAFTAIRLNATNNTAVTGNICINSGEVAIFSEFEFSGSVISNNIVDGAASGISMTNLDSGGQLAVCSGNIVRNITPRSAVNPDTNPIGIFAEAQAAITGNTVQNVPGVAIAAGFGPYLRNVLIASNVISAASIGIGVSIVEGCGPVHIADNMIYPPTEHAVAGLRWTEIAEPDLLANADRYPHVTINGNVVGTDGA